MSPRLPTALLWAGGVALAVVGANLHDPYLAPVRIWGLPAILAGAAAVIAWLLRRRRGAVGLVGLYCAVLCVTAAAEGRFQLCRRAVLAETGADATELGRHFVIGYSRVEDVAPLAAKGLIGGIYVTRRNLATLRRDIGALQTLRQANSLPPLLVATDQEGGVVSHLSPLLPAMPPLADLAALPAGERAEAARRTGFVQGRGLAGLGVTIDFSPVVDLKRPRPALDRNSLIAKRAISADPAVVGTIAASYAEGLRSAGVMPTVKHFPGLGRARADTHHVRARLSAGIDELEATDWRPFRQVLAQTETMLMVGQVTVDAVDPDRPASHSRKVIDGIIRRKWGFHGVVVTDDLSMPSILHHGFCTAVTEALAAGADLLLISFDGQQYYRAMDCALTALRRGRLDRGVLGRSRDRLAGAMAAR